MALESLEQGNMLSSTEDLPTVLLVQGCFHISSAYEKLVHHLIALGHPTVQPQLPSCNNTDSPDFPTITLIDDALAVRSELMRQVEYEGKTVVVAMHSYGGLVGSEAIPEELTYVKRHALGLPGGVIYLIYICAFVLSEGQSVLSAFGESPNNDVRPDGRFYFLGGKEKLYHDLPDSEASLWASRLIPQSHKVQTTKITRAAWRYIPSTYLITENDQAVPTQYQEAFAAGAKSRVERIGTGHSPQLSQPEMLAGRIHEDSKRAMAEFVEGK